MPVRVDLIISQIGLGVGGGRPHVPLGKQREEEKVDRIERLTSLIRALEKCEDEAKGLVNSAPVNSDERNGLILLWTDLCNIIATAKEVTP